MTPKLVVLRKEVNNKMLGNVKVEIKKGGDFDPVPMDRYTCQIVDVNLVSQFNQFVGKEEDVLNYQFQILDDKPMPTKDGEKEAATTRGRYLWKRCRPAFNSRSWLAKLAKAAYGRDLTNAEIDAFDPEAIIGKQVDVMVDQAESKDGQRTFNNVVTFNKTLRPLEPVAETEEKKSGNVVEKSSTPIAPAPSANEAENFVAGLEKEAKAPEAEAEEESDDVADLEAKLAAAKKKAAAAKQPAVK